MASFASYATTVGARKHAWTKNKKFNTSYSKDAVTFTYFLVIVLLVLWRPVCSHNI